MTPLNVRCYRCLGEFIMPLNGGHDEWTVKLITRFPLCPACRPPRVADEPPKKTEGRTVRLPYCDT